MHMLMSWLSLLVHKLLMLMFMPMLGSQVRTGLYKQALKSHLVSFSLFVTVKTIETEHEKPLKNSKYKSSKLSVLVHVFQTTQNLVISRRLRHCPH